MQDCAFRKWNFLLCMKLMVDFDVSKAGFINWGKTMNAGSGDFLFVSIWLRFLTGFLICTNLMDAGKSLSEAVFCIGSNLFNGLGLGFGDSEAVFFFFVSNSIRLAFSSVVDWGTSTYLLVSWSCLWICVYLQLMKGVWSLGRLR